MIDKARIALAEAMGWIVKDGDLYNPNDPSPFDEMAVMPLPNPFTDANDDYAVLEWMRSFVMRHQTSTKDFECRLQGWSWKYQIGDYARAACKVLEIDCE